MNVKVRSIFVARKKFPRFKIEYDKTNKIRPSWIYIKNPLKRMIFLSVRCNKRTIRYFAYLPRNLFLPVIHTKEDLKKYYDKFSEYYDKDIRFSGKGQNIRAAKFLINKIKNLPKNISILDVGAGTGIADEILLKNGFENITLLDNSKKMLEKARKKQSLKKCHFILADFLKFKTKKKFDLIISIFSLGITGYYGNYVENTFNKVRKILKPKGYLVLLGHETEEIFEGGFRTIKRGEYKLNNTTTVNYYIGRKK